MLLSFWTGNYKDNWAPPFSVIDSFQESCKNQDDEHFLIARYASRLAADGAAAVRQPIRALAQSNILLFIKY